MPKYVITGEKTTTFYIYVDADNATVAQRIALDTEWDEWTVDGSEDMEIVSVETW